MRNVELHLMDSNGDVDLGVQAGLMESTDAHDPNCANCNEDVGPIDGAFYPYVVALDNQSQWLVCEDCAGGVLEPNHQEQVQSLSELDD